jgi:hypothetical protein
MAYVIDAHECLDCVVVVAMMSQPRHGEKEW